MWLTQPKHLTIMVPSTLLPSLALFHPYNSLSSVEPKSVSSVIQFSHSEHFPSVIYFLWLQVLVQARGFHILFTRLESTSEINILSFIFLIDTGTRMFHKNLSAIIPIINYIRNFPSSILSLKYWSLFWIFYPWDCFNIHEIITKSL